LYSACNGRFDSVDVKEAKNVIEKMASHSVGYQQSMYVAPTTVGAISSEELFQKSTTSQIEDLKTQLESLKAGSANSVQQVASMQPTLTPMIHAACDHCGMYGHMPYNCQSTVEQVNAFQSFRNNFQGYQNYPSQYSNFNQTPKPTSNYTPPQNSTPYTPPHKTPQNNYTLRPPINPELI